MCSISTIRNAQSLSLEHKMEERNPYIRLTSKKFRLGSTTRRTATTYSYAASTVPGAGCFVSTDCAMALFPLEGAPFPTRLQCRLMISVTPTPHQRHVRMIMGGADLELVARLSGQASWQDTTPDCLHALPSSSQTTKRSSSMANWPKMTS